jgi:hypothetical protein
MVIKKRRIYDADFESVEKVGKKVTEKVTGRIKRTYRGNVPKLINFSEFRAGEVPGRPHVHLLDQ